MKKSNSLFFCFKNVKVFSLLFILSVVLSLFFILPVDAYSSETTDIESYGLDNNQQTYVKIGIYNIYAFDNKLVFYDDNAVLKKTYDIPALTYETNASKTVIYYLNSSCIILAHISGSANNDAQHNFFFNYAYGVLNVDTLSYTSISTGSATTGYWSSTIYGVSGLYGSSLALIKNTNSSGSFYYVIASITGTYLSNQYGIQTFDYTQFAYLGKMFIQSWTASFSVKKAEFDDIFHASNIVIDASYNVPVNSAFIVTSNNFQDSSRATVFSLSFTAPETYNYIGVTGVDNSWTSFLTTNSALSSGMVYLFGVGFYNSKIYINSAFSSSTGTGITFSTLYFNTSYVDSVQVDTGLLSASLIVRPFTGVTPLTSIGGNISGLYTVGYFSLIFGSTGTYTGGYALTGLSFDLTDLETGTPSWSLHELGFLFTPQQTQVNPYDTWQIGGFQQIGSDIGCFVDMVRYNACKANIMYNLAPEFEFNGMLTGDIFNNAVIAQAPTQITLKQGTSYVYTGNIYISNILSGDGNFSVLTSALSTSSTVFNTYQLTNKVDGTVTNGVFSFNLQPVTALNTVYRVIKVNFTLSNGIGENYIYNLGFYGLGDSGDGGLVPYPTNSGSGGVGGGGDSINFITGFLTNWQYMAILITYGVCCGLLTWKFAFTGLIAGLDIATIITFVTGLLGGLMYPVLGLVIVANIALIITGSGLLNKRSNGTES
jgi:hypothetical protein